ncbi:hypothetical protein INT48_005556 [Thamnidium elegans]|uniref:Uncharacterized protein n=1 Tax=Thamnidium elegans TaxID=101142 RepID=A0A8H7SW85_9FUNG|nr:hypothetical protein INT48_005556 [Thamnidium elegans]
MDLGNAEFAKQAVTNKNKYYNDKTKSLLAAKVHLNHIITNTKHLPPQIARNMPVLQTIGTSCRAFYAIPRKQLQEQKQKDLLRKVK